MRMRKKKNLIPRMERCAAVHVRDGFVLRGKWRETLMPAAKELRLELGCGKGRFTAETARANPDILFIAIEKVPDAMVVAMERAVAMELKNVFFVVGDAALLPDYFAPGEADLIYINFCDPWPPKRQAKRRLTHRGFLSLYREVLKDGGRVEFKTDNAPLFAFSLEEFPAAGYALQEVTDDLHAGGPQGVMTDYEAKFYAEGVPIHRCVGVKLARLDMFPAETRDAAHRWLAAFAAGAGKAAVAEHVLAEGNYLWHVFSWEMVPHLTGEDARRALEAAAGEMYFYYFEYPPAGEPLVRPVTREEALRLAGRPREAYSSLDGMDWYLVDRDFTWTYVHTHEEECGPYFCRVPEKRDD